MRALVLLALLVPSVVLLVPSVAYAGWCDEETAATFVGDTEAFAAGKLKEMPDAWGLCFDQVIEGDQKLGARFINACETIVQDDPDNRICIQWSVELGAKKLGQLDLVDATTSLFDVRPFEDGGSLGIHLLVKLDDARALPIVKEKWLAGDKDKRARSDKNEMVYRWSIWRHAAIKLFASRGTTDDVAFLRDELKRTKDASVRRAITRAIKTIEKRA
jgi:hypothetical protein